MSLLYYLKSIWKRYSSTYKTKSSKFPSVYEHMCRTSKVKSILKEISISRNGADFILTIAGKNIIPIEVDIGEKLGTQVRNTMKKVRSATYGMVICSNELTLLEDANVIKVPLDYFLLI